MEVTYLSEATKPFATLSVIPRCLSSLALLRTPTGHHDPDATIVINLVPDIGAESTTITH